MNPTPEDPWDLHEHITRENDRIARERAKESNR
ncbi:hypothetical protein BJY18_004708 [Amycolatopsis jiangsuensis]|uniref:Uncharacterized protein n=1 Tax=Amycolatopsis jiangsuensis TaxID=1181879 RepID=A0A840IZW6_9PSEU|nr:hypothetical protein [Amycolatopsis jiangsuensis]